MAARRVLVCAWATAVVVGLACVPLARRYHAAQLAARQADVARLLGAQGAALTGAIEGRIRLLDAVSADAASEDESDGMVEPALVRFAQQMLRGEPAVDSLTIVRIDGSECVLVPDPSAPAKWQRLPNPEELLPPVTAVGGAHTGVFGSLSADHGLWVARRVTRDGRPWGTVVLRADPLRLVQQARIDTVEHGLLYALCGPDGRTAAGNPEVAGMAPLQFDGATSGIDWTLDVVPNGGWGEGRPVLLYLAALGVWLVLTSLLAGIVMRHAALTDAVDRRTGELLRANDELRKEICERVVVEQTLRDSDAFRESILSAVPTGVMVVDRETQRVVHVNDAALRILGTCRDVLVGEHCGGTFCGAHGGRCPLMERGQAIRGVETTVIQPDGWQVPVLRTVVGAEVGGRNYTIESFTDISQQKEMHRELKVSRERYRALLDNSPDIVVQFDREGRILYVNPSAARLVGRRPDELLGSSQVELFGQQYALMHNRQIQEVFITGEAQSCEQLEVIQNQKRWLDVRLTPVRDDHGCISSVLGILRDITERKQAEEEQRRLVAILEATTDFVAIADAWGKTIYLNRAGRQMAGLAPDADIRGMPLSLFYPADELPLLTEHVLNTAVREGVWSGEASLLHREGGRIPTSQVIVAHRTDAGEVTHFSTVIRDLTVMKQAECELKEMNKHLEERVRERTARVEQLLAHKQGLLNQLSHDLKTPLTPLTALLPLVAQSHPSPQAREMLSVCSRNVEYMNDLVSETLELCRMDASSFEIAPAPIALREVVEQALEQGSYRFMHTHIAFANSVPDDVKALGDSLRLREVLVNLFDNACRYMPGGGTLTVAADPPATDGMLTVHVTDTGAGIPHESVDRVFDEFYKVDESRHDRKTSGLGLAICRKIIEHHQGRIWAESGGEGAGTTIHFSLPAAA